MQSSLLSRHDALTRISNDTQSSLRSLTSGRGQSTSTFIVDRFPAYQSMRLGQTVYCRLFRVFISLGSRSIDNKCLLISDDLDNFTESMINTEPPSLRRALGYIMLTDTEKVG